MFYWPAIDQAFISFQVRMASLAKRENGWPSDE
jgi:hypothetical protein